MNKIQIYMALFFFFCQFLFIFLFSIMQWTKKKNPEKLLEVKMLSINNNKLLVLLVCCMLQLLVIKYENSASPQG